MTDRKKKWPRRLRIRSVPRDPVDIPKLGRALIELARAQAEKEAEEHHQQQLKAKSDNRPKPYRRKPNA